MKLKQLFISAMAIVAIAAGCKKTEFVRSVISVEGESSYTVEVDQYQQAVELNITANCAWVVKENSNWIDVRPNSGSGNKKITIYVAPNEAGTREATVNIYKDDSRKVCAPICVRQTGVPGADPVVGPAIPEGDGTLASPLNASQANAEGAKLASGAVTPQAYYIEGYIKKMASGHESGVQQYGNASFYITDTSDGSGTDFYAYRIYDLGNKKFTDAGKVKVGDRVIIYGRITNYNGTAETEGNGKAYLYSLNGQTEDGGTTDPDNPTDPSEPITGENLIGNPSFENWASGKPVDWASITQSNATISQATEAHSGTYSVKVDGSVDANKRLMSKVYTLSAGTYQIDAYTKAAADGAKVRIGYAIVNADGTIDTANYRYLTDPSDAGSDWTLFTGQFNLDAEAKVSLAIMNSKNGGGAAVLVDDVTLKTNNGGVVGGGDTDPTDPDNPTDPSESIANTPETAYTTSEAIALYDAGKDLTTKVYVKGTFVKNLTSADKIDQYKNLDIIITDGTSEFELYHCRNIDNTDFTSNPFKEGDELVAYGTLAKYNTTYELKDCYVVSYTSDGGENPDPDPDPDPDPTPEPTGTNLLTTGDFESWADGKPEGWCNIIGGTGSSASNATITKSEDAYSGNYSVSIAKNSDNKRIHCDALKLKAGTYSYTVHTKTDDNGQFKLGYGPIKEDGTCDTGKLTYIDSSPVNAGNGSWAEYTVTFKLDAESEISLFVCNFKKSGEFRVDGISLTTTDGGLVGGEEPQDPTTGETDLSTMNSMDAYRLTETDGKKYWIVSIYEYDYLTEGLASDVSIDIMFEANNVTAIGGTHTILSDSTFTDAEGNVDEFTNGTITLALTEEETDEYWPLYKAVINATLASGKTIDVTLPDLETIAIDGDTLDVDAGNIDYITLTATLAASAKKATVAKKHAKTQVKAKAVRAAKIRK